MRSLDSSHALLTRLLPGLLLGSLGTGCNARLDLGDEPISPDGGAGGSIAGPSPTVDAGRAHCDDGIRDGDESDIDCGGDACGTCATGASCDRHADCASNTCLAGLCTAASCEDGLRNGDETGVDCGGECTRCPSSRCNCATSAELTALECDETEAPLTRCGTRGMLSADGETFVFAMCHTDPTGNTTTSVDLYRRKADGTRDALGDAGALGLSSDGQRLLIYDASAVRVINAEGASTLVPIPQEFSTDVRLSGDGVTVFGGVANGTGGRTLARWTENGGLETLGEPPLLADAINWELAAVSHDGSVVVGSAEYAAGPVPFRWTASGGVEDLGTLPEGAVGARPAAISDDGSTVAGFTVRSDNASDIFRWSAQSPLTVMGRALPVASFPDAGTLLLSPDGAILVAAAGPGADGPPTAGPRVVRWGTGGTASSSGGLAFVTDMTPDGSVLVGNQVGTSGFLWRPPAEVSATPPPFGYDLTRLDTMLAQTSIDTTGWTFESISNISDDGRIIYGGGTCGGVPTYYRMQLSP